MPRDSLISCLYVWLRLAFIIIEILNTIIFLVGFASTDRENFLTGDSESTQVRKVFVTIRGLTILGSDIFAAVALVTVKLKYFWASFGFIVMSFMLSIINSAIVPSSLSRVDLDFDLLCFVLVLLLIREVSLHEKKMQENFQEYYFPEVKSDVINNQQDRPLPSPSSVSGKFFFSESGVRPKTTIPSFLQLNPLTIPEETADNKASNKC